MPISLSGTNGVTFPSWTTATRPASPAAGQTGYNTTTNAIDTYNGSSWTSVLMPTSQGTSGQALLSGGAGVAPTWGSASLALQAVQTGNFTAVAGNIYPVNTSSSAITVSLPASPSAGNMVTIFDYAGTASTNNIQISGNGNKINKNSVSNLLISTDRQSVNLIYVDATQGWVSYAQQYAAPGFVPYSVTYLAIAGGGSGGGGTGWEVGGGGGAGGFLSGSLTLSPTIVYTITVGAGGAGAVPGGNNGSNSTISGSSITTQTSIGGGRGNGGIQTVGNGGSGGGGSGNAPTGGGTGTSGQGNNGGNGSTASDNSAGGGGGGAGAAGGNASSPNGGAGGAGSASSITGSSVTYAGGGGGSAASNGTGTNGAGGSGGGAAGNGGAGTANTGGGGGGTRGSVTSGSGGSGVVILSVPTTYYSGNTTGSPTVTTSGANTILKYTSSGTYTA